MDSDKRTKVSRACDYCKKRKIRCSGKPPCDLCIKKDIDCTFSIIDKRTIRKSTSTTTITTSKKDSLLPKPKKITKDKSSVDKKTIQLLSKKTDLPETLQPLESFPLHKVQRKDEQDHQQEDENIIVDNPQQPEGQLPQPNQSTESTPSVEESKVLYDSAGNLRYVGESSPLSFLFEVRNIFNERIGPSKFSSETDSLEVIVDPDDIFEISQVVLPTRAVMNDLVRIFYVNVVNASYYVDINYFMSEIVPLVYEHYNECSPGKIALVNLIIALGLFFAECTNDEVLTKLQSDTMKSNAYFEFGFYLTKKYMNKGKFWLTEAFALAYCFYQIKQERNTAWLMLGMSIRNAQALGLHRKYINESFKERSYIVHRRRLFKSLYILDRITSVLLGRPLIIDDYDCDDFDSEDIFHIDKDGVEFKDPRIQCMIYGVKLSHIIGKVTKNFYLDGILDPYKAEKLGMELKLWALNLPEDLQVDKVFVDSELVDPASENFVDHKMPLLIMHLCQLYSIVLLCRPFFMYLIFDKKRRKHMLTKPKTKNELAMSNFVKVATKSSLLIIQMVENYTNSLARKTGQVESHGVTHACFMASLIIGLSILYLEQNRYTSKDLYYSAKLMKYLNIAKKIFLYYNVSNPVSIRFHNIVESMQSALMTKFDLDMDGNKTKPVKKQQPPIPIPQPPQQPPPPQSSSDDMDIDQVEYAALKFNQDYELFFENFHDISKQPLDNLVFTSLHQPRSSSSSSAGSSNPNANTNTNTNTNTKTTTNTGSGVPVNMQRSPGSNSSDNSGSPSSTSSSHIKEGNTNNNNRSKKEPLDAFMYSMDLNDMLQ
ncbi:FGR27 Filamentous growth regulator 27 [Candida maltosa Xu316]